MWTKCGYLQIGKYNHEICMTFKSAFHITLHLYQESSLLRGSHYPEKIKSCYNVTCVEIK